MSETGFKCPKCGFEGSFMANEVTLFCETMITPDGWDYMYGDSYGCELPPGAQLTCGECDYTSDWKEFEAACCPDCGGDEVIHVSSGVDENGEWHTLECDGCGKVWVVEGDGR